MTMKASGAFFILAAAIMGVTSVEARADCDARAFMVKDVRSIQQSGETELAFVLTATREEYEAAKKNGALGGTYKLFSASLNYQEARQKATRIAQATRFDYHNSYASNYLSQTLSGKALDNYVACLERDKERPGLALWLQHRDGNYFTFRAFWVGADTRRPAARYDTPPVVDGGKIISNPEAWLKAKTEEIVVKRDGNNDLFLNLTVGGQTKSMVVVKDPPAVEWMNKPVTSEKLIKAHSHGPNPGCTGGEATDCIHPAHPGGLFVSGTATMVDGTSSDPSHYTALITRDMPSEICVKMTQFTGACEVTQSAQGRLTAVEMFPQVEK